MLVCSSFVACTNEETPEVNNGGEKGEKSYVAVNIVMPGDVQSRAGEEYEAGTTDENAVTKAVFLFLDKDFNGCAEPCTVTSLEWEAATGTGEDKQSKAVLVINDGDKQVPSYIVAVLNPKNTYTKATSLANLKAEKETYTSLTTNGEFVMTNSVYVGTNGKEVAATPISIENVKSNPSDALNAPVTIYVERVVGKVEVTGLDAAAGKWTTDETYTDGNDMGLKLQIKGWNVLQNKKSHTVKNVNVAWNYGWWNNASLHRSFWANDAASEGRTEYKVDELSNVTSVYVEETVNPTPNTHANGTSSPYLLVSGKFVDTNDNAVELVEWRGEKYTKDGYLNFIAENPEVSQYWYKDGETYKQFGPALLQMTDDTNDWNATATLTSDAEKITFGLPTFNADGTMKSLDTENVTLDDVKDAVAAFGKVQYWNGGNTYYYVPITHQVDGNNTYYGVVRNHVYKVAISAISGFGTPVANPDQAIDIPENPTDDDSYLAAKVVVLKWKIVENNDVTLGNGN